MRLIIQSAVFKLTLSYLGIIMVLSALFSTALYRASYDQLSENAEHQRVAIQRLPLPLELEPRRAELNQVLANQLHDSRQSLLIRLAGLNLLTLLAGGGAAYIFARRTLRPVQDALEAQGRFTADASHELRTPLTAMRSEIEVALRDKKLTAAEARALLGSNLEEIAKLEALSAGLLRLARSENGLDPATVTDVRIADLFEAAIDRFQPQLVARKIELEANSGKETVSGDRDSLIELVAILLDNAVKYSPEGSAISLVSQPASSHVIFKVADHGHGIKATEIPHIFDRFYRADRSRTKEAVGGYGLGLSIAKRITGLHHGQIWVESKPGIGTTFFVKLPIHQPQNKPLFS